jgi:hypothetical protein
LLGASGSGQAKKNSHFGPEVWDVYRNLKSVYEGELEGTAVDYPAVDVWKSLISPALYLNSRMRGTAALLRDMKAARSDCSSTRFILVGFSQGADVVTSAWHDMNASQRASVAAVLLFGDPHYKPRLYPLDQGDAHRSDAGGLFDQSTDLPAEKARNYCLDQDPVCNQPSFYSVCINADCPHYQYVSGGWTYSASNWVVSLLGRPLYVATTGLGSAAQGLPYSQRLAAGGGTRPYAWSAKGLPAGLSVVGSSITGTPRVGGTFVVTLRVRDAKGAASSLALPLRVAPTAHPEVVVNASAVVGGKFNATLTPSVPCPPGTSGVAFFGEFDGVGTLPINADRTWSVTWSLVARPDAYKFRFTCFSSDSVLLQYADVVVRPRG